MAIFGKGGRGGDHHGEPGNDRFAILAEVRAYWEGLRREGALPRRDEVDPRGIARALENTFLIERIAPGIGRFRIAGMQLHDLMGMDVRGMPLSSLIEPAGRNRLAEALEGVFSGPGTLEICLEGERGIGRPALTGRLLLLPLSAQRGDTTLAMGCLAMDGALGRAPRRFAIAGVMSEKLTLAAPMGTETPAPYRSPQTAHHPGLAEEEIVFRPRPPRGKPQLRLVHSRD